MNMREWDTTRIIVVGLVIMGIVSTAFYYICMILGLSPTIEPTISIITGLFSAIGVVTGTAIGKQMKKTGEPKNGEEDEANGSGERKGNEP